MADATIIRIFDKLDDLSKEVSDMNSRLARVEENQKSHYKENDHQHNDMTSNIVEVKDDLEKVAGRIDEVESILDRRTGQHSVFGGIWHFLAVLAGGGALTAIGGYLAKMIGIF